MPSHLQVTDEIAETAALYALGLLSESERSSLDRHLEEGCPICQSEISRCGDLLAEWAQQAPVAAPSSLRRKLMRNLAVGPAAVETRLPVVLLNRSGLTLLRTTRMDWQPGPSPGLWTKILFHDAESDMNTLLVRLGAGALYPPHRHMGTEEVYVLEGELQVEGVELKVGDFCVSQPDSVHQNTYSKSGCLLMVKSSKHDEVLR